MAKYDPLRDYLKSSNSSKGEHLLNFAAVERILNDELPASARNYRTWWGNQVKGSHVQAKAWFAAGWKVESVNLKDEVVRFTRK